MSNFTVIVKEQITINHANKLMYGKCYKSTELLFPSEKVKLRSTSSISTCFRKLCKLIKTKNNDNTLFICSNAHMLRHTFVTRCLEAGMNIKVVSKLLGHSKIQITLDTYSHVLEQFQDDEVSKVKDYFMDKELY